MKQYYTITKEGLPGVYLRQVNPLKNEPRLVSAAVYAEHERLYEDSALLFLNPVAGKDLYFEHDLKLQRQFFEDGQWQNCENTEYIAAEDYREVFICVTLAEVITFQRRAFNWGVDCFGSEITMNIPEKNRRFIEEALELVQSTGMSKEEVLRLVVYVFGRDKGEPAQEIGGVTVTLGILVEALGLNLEESALTELNRVEANKDAIRAKHQYKISQGVGS